MSSVVALQNSARDWIALARELGQCFATRAAAADADDRFVEANVEALKAAGFIEAGVPAELGGRGAAYRELVQMLCELARHCGSTALAFSMHTHLVVTATWRWRHGEAVVETLLRRTATEQLMLIGSGGSDWLGSSGTARRTAGGYLVKAHKGFASGVPAGDLLLTSAVADSDAGGKEVIHFAVPLKDKAVRIVENWRTLGMRGTGSHDVEIDDLFIDDAAITLRRPRGKWHPLFHGFAMLAIPLIYGVYLGIAEAARDRALELARGRAGDPVLPYLVGEMERELLVARLSHRHMLEAAETGQPCPVTTNSVMAGRALVGQAAIRTVEKAMEVAGGAGFHRSHGLERLFRDVQAARYHPLQDKAQLRLAGRQALGLPIDE